ncbi:hypothetical protein CRG98_020145 [Punica granatum]|uniref:Uncharacterized protein n=1 Tax=Punica granatum TaxID=22663 RepID=A0A2I0JT26_PUNGR|nr:hypothetical protein CRG98_020145 [Punica granatum]
MPPILHQNTTGSLRDSHFFPTCPVGPVPPSRFSFLLANPTLFLISRKSTCPILPNPLQMRSLVSWESNATGPARKFHPDQPVQPRQAGLPVGSAADPTSLIRVCSFQGGRTDFPSPFSGFPRLYPHPGASASMSGNSLNQSRGDIVVSSKPKEPLGLTPREVAESPSWLPRAMDGLLSPTQVVSQVFTFFASYESVSFYRFLQISCLCLFVCVPKIMAVPAM